MKSIKTKMILVVSLLMAISLGLVGGTVAVLMYNSSIESLTKTMTTTAGVAGRTVAEYLETFRAVANEVGLLAPLSSPETPLEEKRAIVEEKRALYGFLAGNITDTQGQGQLEAVDVSDRDYFQQALNGVTTISNVVESRTLNKLTIIVAAPIWQGGIAGSAAVGVVYFQIDAKVLSELTDEINIGTTGSAYLLDSENYTIAHDDYSLVENRDNTAQALPNNPELSALAELEAKMAGGEAGFGIYNYAGVQKLIAYAPVPTEQGWSIGVNAELNEFLQSTINAIIITVILVVAAILVGIVASVLLARSITRPLVQVEQAAQKMAEGDFDVEISYRSKNEIGSLAASMADMVASTKAVIEDTSRGLNEIAAGNFNIAPRVEYKGVFEQIKNSMVRIITELSDTLSQIRMASEQVSAGSSQVSDGAQSLAQGATEQASVMQEFSASLGEISQQVNTNSAQAAQANTLAGTVKENVAQSNRQMAQMMSAMDEISDSSHKIGMINKTIEDIAFQTNILALNAAVEAARAGDAGKGFAVVADEVRSLAAKSSEAAQQTGSLIENSISAVKNGADIAETTANSLSTVVQGADEITEIIQQIAKGANEQAASILQINTGIEQISSVVQANSATSEESAATSEELNGQAESMKAQVAKFQLLQQPLQALPASGSPQSADASKTVEIF